MRCKYEKSKCFRCCRPINLYIKKVEKFDISGIELSERVLDNRIITLEGYMRFLETEAIPKLSLIRDNLAAKMNAEKDGE